MKDHDPSHYTFARQASRMHRLDRLEFEDPVPPLRPIWRDLLWIVVIAALIAAAIVLEIA